MIYVDTYLELKLSNFFDLSVNNALELICKLSPVEYSSRQLHKVRKNSQFKNLVNENLQIAVPKTWTYFEYTMMQGFFCNV